MGELVWILLLGFRLPLWCHLGLIVGVAGSLLGGRSRRTCGPLLGGLVLSLVGVVAQGKYFPYHLIVALPWFALLLGAAAEALVRIVCERTGVSLRRAAGVATALT